MNPIRIVRAVAALTAVLFVASVFAAANADLDKAMSSGGLHKIAVKGIDIAYARPGATLSSYDRVMLEPVDVAFHKNWNPTRAGSRMQLSAKDRESIRTGVADLVYQAFVNELQKSGSYQVVNDAGPGVLRVKAHIVNLYVNAPGAPTGGPSRTYTLSAGEMTIFAELYDSQSGELLARVADRREARRTGLATLTNGVVNADEAGAIAADWARILRDALDKAHRIGTR